MCSSVYNFILGILFLIRGECHRMKVIKVKDSVELGKVSASIIIKTIKKLYNPVLGLATGSSPEKLYDNLVKEYQTGKVSFENVDAFNLDEYVGLSGNHPNSFRYYLDRKLFNKVNIDKERTYLPNGLASNLKEECEQYEQKINNKGNIDIQIIGLGLNGHIAFNEPGTSFYSKTQVVDLDASTIEANSYLFTSKENVPTQAISMGIDTIMKSKKILFIVEGEKKADILKKVVHGEVTENVPASILQHHPNVILVTDIDI